MSKFGVSQNDLHLIAASKPVGDDLLATGTSLEGKEKRNSLNLGSLLLLARAWGH